MTFLHFICNLRGFCVFEIEEELAFLAAAQGVLWYLQCPGYDNLFEPDVQGVAAVAKDRRNRVGLEVAHFGSESHLFFNQEIPTPPSNWAWSFGLFEDVEKCCSTLGRLQ